MCCAARAATASKLALVPWPAEPQPDDRLRLIFTCCHPALPRAAQVALTLRVVCGLTTAQIAKAFLVPESTVGQRITRAKRKISDAGIPYRIPSADELGARLAEVLAVIYLLFNEGYLSSGGEQAQSRDLADDAEFLAALLHQLMPTEPEVGRAARADPAAPGPAGARFDGHDEIIQLQHQDRISWDHDAIADAGRLIARAAARKRPGPYQLQAAIVACHAEAERWEDTDWAQIVVLYDMLLHLRRRRSPGCTARSPCATSPDRQPHCPKSTPSPDDLDDYHLFHATRAELLRDLGRAIRRRAADERALALTANPAERSLLRQRLAGPDRPSSADKPAGRTHAAPTSGATWSPIPTATSSSCSRGRRPGRRWCAGQERVTVDLVGAGVGLPTEATERVPPPGPPAHRRNQPVRASPASRHGAARRFNRSTSRCCASPRPGRAGRLRCRQNCNRPPGRSTRRISVNTAALCTHRLITPLEITTSAQQSGSGSASARPSRNSTRSTPKCADVRRDLVSISSVMSTPTT